MCKLTVNRELVSIDECIHILLLLIVNLSRLTSVYIFCLELDMIWCHSRMNDDCTIYGLPKSHQLAFSNKLISIVYELLLIGFK